ncbi:transport protein Avl9-domain-containing protein [Microdochium trichocladiopsis]|uniref:Transport protein Avl9-domain-containing protein n=1 Tax=Microdochium trichocladiopsis TaxID=1682393 RepID=A0A9P8YBH5_9PEZI|nr:transport protein Avl9-domain-containing protein [Microdochium trichocladiopsis]KAH7035438.1 transport protein Avl9-domain-containing protein [Microdochium trichocladiopsis]
MSGVDAAATTASTPGSRTPESNQKGFTPLVAVVDFHHARGPEVERWFGVEEGRDPAEDWAWPNLPFMALSDGAHASTEDFSYFTLLRPATGDGPATSLFGISCTRQLDASQLLNRPPEVTRSTVQKAVVVIADTPQFFGMLRERLSVVTSAWFLQREFTDVEILRRFQDSLAEEKERGQLSEADRDQYLGMSLRELVREFKWQTLVLLKCCLLQHKMLFFGSRCERLCMMQFSLVSLIPGLLRNLEDCAGPELNNYEKNLKQPTSLRTSDRSSLLAYMGLPLQIFGQGSLFGPYTPLQQLDLLADQNTKSYIVGSTNSLLLQQKDRYSDILINLDDKTINITSSSLRSALALSHADRRWIDAITQEVNDTWDEANPGRPKTMGYRGSEEFIRLQFEEYLLSLISSVKYHNYLAQNSLNPRAALPHIEGDPAHDFNTDWIDVWERTNNYRLWVCNTDSHLFDIVEPRHPCAGGLSVDDVQRRIQQQVQDMHLDERFAVAGEVLGRNLAAGREKANTIFNKLYSDMEAMREAQRRRAEEARSPPPSAGLPPAGAGHNDDHMNSTATSSVGAKAGAYIGSWTSWASQKHKQAWGRPSASEKVSSLNTSSTNSSSGGSGGWTSAWGRKSRSTDSERTTPVQSPITPHAPRFSMRSGVFNDNNDTAQVPSGYSAVRPSTQDSFGESMLDSAMSDSGRESVSTAPPSPERRRDAPSAPLAASSAAVASPRPVQTSSTDTTATAEQPKPDLSAPATTATGTSMQGDRQPAADDEPVPSTSSASQEPKP